VPFTIWSLEGALSHPAPDETTTPQTKTNRAPSPELLHSTSLAVHAANTVLVFLILCFCIPNAFGAFLGAALFAVHPLQVEAVVWVSAFKYLIGSFFAFAAIWEYLRYQTKKETSSRSAAKVVRHYYIATGLFLLAVLSHPAMAVAPVVAFVVERLIPNKTSLY